MARKVLLFSINPCTEPYPVFPLGLAHIDAALHQAGYETEWFDVQVDNEPLPELLARVRPDFIGISLRNIDDVIIKTQETYFGSLVALCRELRGLTKVPIVLGGSGFSIFPERLLKLSGAEFGIHGAGEASFPALLEALITKSGYGDVPGLLFRRDREIVKNARAAWSTRDGIIPRAPRRLTDFYLRHSSMLNVQTQRGCSHRCCYCTYPLIEGRKYLRRTAASVAEELDEIQKSAQYVFIVDSVFNSSAEHVAEICEEILRREIKLRWGCFLRPAKLTPKLMQLMGRAGLAHIEFGSDSFCDSVLRDYGKSFTFDDIRHSSELARKEKIDFCHFLICGGPGETLETLRATYENSRLLQDAVVMALVGMRIYPGTALFERARGENVVPEGGDLLEPKYYLTPELTKEQIFNQLRSFSRVSPNWIVGEPHPDYLRMTERLRAKGVVGPLWSFFAMMQRLVGFSPQMDH